MRVHVHDDPKEFWSATEKLFRSDPIRHTVAISAMRGLLQAPDLRDDPPVLLTLWDGGQLAAAAVRTPPWPLISSGVPGAHAAEMATALVAEDPELPGVSGPRDTAEPFGAAWSTVTGRTTWEVMAGRLYRLVQLDQPAVPGRPRHATDDDVPLLAQWRRAFTVEAVGPDREPDKHELIVRHAMRVGDAQMVWVIDGRVVAWAGATAPFEGMTRVGPVYTPPEFRGGGYGCAVTAAASGWALDAGAQHVVLFTDLGNPTSNSIYQRIGYRPVYDSTELEFHHRTAHTLGP
jgi:predicted GNAT family acetyltransferase